MTRRELTEIHFFLLFKSTLTVHYWSVRLGF